METGVGSWRGKRTAGTESKLVNSACCCDMCLWCELELQSLISTFPADRAVCTMGGMAELKLACCVYSVSKKHEQGAIIKLFLMNLVVVSIFQGDQKQKLRAVVVLRLFKKHQIELWFNRKKNINYKSPLF